MSTRWSTILVRRSTSARVRLRAPPRSATTAARTARSRSLTAALLLCRTHRPYDRSGSSRPGRQVCAVALVPLRASHAGKRLGTPDLYGVAGCGCRRLWARPTIPLADPFPRKDPHRHVYRTGGLRRKGPSYPICAYGKRSQAVSPVTGVGQRHRHSGHHQGRVEIALVVRWHRPQDVSSPLLRVSVGRWRRSREPRPAARGRESTGRRQGCARSAHPVLTSALRRDLGVLADRAAAATAAPPDGPCGWRVVEPPDDDLDLGSQLEVEEVGGAGTGELGCRHAESLRSTVRYGSVYG